MKTITRSVSIAVVLTFVATVANGFTIDGTAAPGEYPAGQPLAVQALGSTAGANTNGVVNVSSGSQLDAAYGAISNGTLYLLIAGNMQSDLTRTYDKLSIFIDTGASGQNTLSNNTQTVDGTDIPTPPMVRMSYGGDPFNCDGCPGLTFDNGFNAAYWIGISFGFKAFVQDPTNSTLYANYAQLPAGGGGGGYYLGNSQPTNGVLSGGDANPFGIQAAMNNSNTGGVDTNWCNVNTNGVAQSIAAATVQTGVELAVSLNALGGPNIVGPVRVCAFLTPQDYSSIYDQLLGPVAISGCVDAFAFGDPLTNNFSTLPGTHSFTIPIVGCSYTISPFNALFNATGGSGSFTVGALGGGTCGWTATSSASWLKITSGSSGSGPGTVSYTVSNNTAVAVRTGTITVTGAANGVDVFTVTEAGQALARDFVVDGTAEAAYGCPLAVQQIGTGFGDNTSGNAIPSTSGSELDAAYGMVENGVLFLVLAGNLENNNNSLNIFFMTGPGGLSTLSSNQSSAVGRNILNNMGAQMSSPGLTFDTGFAPNYWIGVNGSGQSPYSFYVDYAQLWPGGTNAAGIATNGYFVGYNHGTNGIMLADTGGKNPFNIQATINNSNPNGVDGGPGSGVGCATNAAGALESTQAATVTNGVELGIPLAVLGNPTGTIAVCAFIASADGTYMSNQLLGPLGTNDQATLLGPPGYCQINLGAVTNTAAINLNNFPGQHYFWVGPEMRVTGVSRTVSAGTTNVNVSVLPENSTNLLYQLQRTFAPLTTTSVWANVGPQTNGGPAAIILTDPHATNKVGTAGGILYRVRQAPNCVR